MRTTELIDLVMNLIVYPYLIIVYTIIEKSVIHISLIKAINNLLHTKLIYYDLKESLTQQTNAHHTFVTPCINESKRNEKEGHLYFIKADHYSTFGSTRNISYLSTQNRYENINSKVMKN